MIEPDTVIGMPTCLPCSWPSPVAIISGAAVWASNAKKDFQIARKDLEIIERAKREEAVAEARRETTE